MSKSRASKLRDRRRVFVNELKSSKGCAVCGDKRHYVLVFHHRDHKNHKEGNIGVLISETAGMDRLKEEISKCDILCANCHRELHYLERNNLSKTK